MPYNLHYAVVGDAVLITTEDMAIYRQLKQRVSLDLNGEEFSTALKGLARDTGVNLILDPRVAKEGQARVSLQVDAIPLQSAVRLLAEMAGLKAMQLGNSLFLAAKANAAELRSEPDLTPAGIPGAVDTDIPVLARPGVAVAPAVPAPAEPAPVPAPPAPAPKR